MKVSKSDHLRDKLKELILFHHLIVFRVAFFYGIPPLAYNLE